MLSAESFQGFVGLPVSEILADNETGGRLISELPGPAARADWPRYAEDLCGLLYLKRCAGQKIDIDSPKT